MKIEYKSAGLEVKDIDTKTRRVLVALAKFDTVDSDGDAIKKGAFAKSILERGPESSSNRKIAFLRHHDWEQQIGKFIKIEETHEYLLGLAELGRSTKGNDALLDYQDGIINEHSIGFNIITDKTVFQNDIRVINEVKLWEGSAVTFGANEYTPTLDVSKGNYKDYLEKVNARMESVIKALRNGEGTDERLFCLEMQLQTIKQQYNSLATYEPTDEVTPTTEPNTPTDGTIGKSFYHYILTK